MKKWSFGLLLGILLWSLPVLGKTVVVPNIEMYFRATTIALFEGNNGTEQLCSVFFAKDISGHKYLWTAAHCCLFKDGESLQTLSILIGEGKNEQELVLHNVLDASDPDRNGHDVCRIPADTLPVPLKKWPIAAPEELDEQGVSLETPSMVVSRFNRPPYEDQCGSIEPLILTQRVGTIAPFRGPYRVYLGCAFPGRSGSPVISLRSGNIVGVLTAVYWKKAPTKNKPGILGGMVGVTPLTYTAWYLDILLKKRAPPLPLH